MKKRFLTAIALLSIGNLAQAEDIVFRIGYQKGGIFTALKSLGWLDEAAKYGIKYEWYLFPAGPQLLEAQRANAVDFGSTGDTPSIFALAAGTPLKYVGITKNPNPRTSAILVTRDSPIKSVKELKGKKVALQRGSSAHYFTQLALQEVGLDLNDIEIINLPPAEARGALESGAVQAWVIWDPFYAIAQAGNNVKVIRDNKGLTDGVGYWITVDRVLKDPGKKKALSYLLAELKRTADWANNNPDKLVDLWNEELGIPKDILKVVVKRALPYRIQPFPEKQLAYLQKESDAFFELGVIPVKTKFVTDFIGKVPFSKAGLQVVKK
ncbi:aliphatic sulfonate ABC transporter substrate-binding protein [Deinococcus cellulosilyticus]|uniref:Putative aliphatic sulfonates-binding protein n=1 Tax=Deinococcus cellulosilyticus (strain DSM 18568 / NBRC 106333 / KACC 11606 / 5516J-15) TaxID=1223518 RepID=A0A511N920_DEIC1|nr:aliphatic sulfonate ABC transporter substrate-binding protein [Deinococcus cellulosilyticus]GEM49349.1 sulfonate ABC transporter substrate-binding protein [Deinococcus cellulosilyticus NBRC 106333 = KACC 11606]